MTRKLRHTKQQIILSAALSLFRRTHDVNKVSLETIAREAKVSPTTIYNNFGSREKLLYEVTKALLKESLERYRSLLRSDIPFPQKLLGIISGKLELASELNREIVEKIISQDRVLAAFIDEIYEAEMRPLWIEMLAEGKKQGYVDTALDDDALLLYLDVLKAGFGARQNVLRSLTDNPCLIEQLTNITFYGFIKKDIGLFKKGSQDD